MAISSPPSARLAIAANPGPVFLLYGASAPAASVIVIPPRTEPICGVGGGRGPKVPLVCGSSGRSSPSTAVLVPPGVRGVVLGGHAEHEAALRPVAEEAHAPG